MPGRACRAARQILPPGRRRLPARRPPGAWPASCRRGGEHGHRTPHGHFAAAIPTQTSASTGRAAAPARRVGMPDAAGSAEVGAGFAAELRCATEAPAPEAESANAAFLPDARPSEPAPRPPQDAPPLPAWPTAAWAVLPQTERGGTAHSQASPPSDALAAEKELAEDSAAIPTTAAALAPQADGAPPPPDALAARAPSEACADAAPAMAQLATPVLPPAETMASAPLAAAPAPSTRGQVDTAIAQVEGALPTAERGPGTAAIGTSAAPQLPSQQAASRGSGNAGPPTPRGTAHDTPADSAADATASTRPIAQDTAPDTSREAQPDAAAATQDAPHPLHGSTETALAERPSLLAATPFAATGAATPRRRRASCLAPLRNRGARRSRDALRRNTGIPPSAATAAAPRASGRAHRHRARARHRRRAAPHRGAGARGARPRRDPRGARQRGRERDGADRRRAAGNPCPVAARRTATRPRPASRRHPAFRRRRCSSAWPAASSARPARARRTAAATAATHRRASARDRRHAALLDPARPPNRAGRLTLLDIAI